jgi:flagellar basal body-associated protein FliL
MLESIVAVLAAALGAILYFFGKKEGQKNEQKKVAKQVYEAEEERIDAEYEENMASDPDDRVAAADAIMERARKSGQYDGGGRS